MIVWRSHRDGDRVKKFSDKQRVASHKTRPLIWIKTCRVVEAARVSQASSTIRVPDINGDELELDSKPSSQSSTYIGFEDAAVQAMTASEVPALLA